MASEPMQSGGARRLLSTLIDKVDVLSQMMQAPTSSGVSEAIADQTVATLEALSAVRVSIDALHVDLTASDPLVPFVDGLEALISSTNSKLDALVAATRAVDPRGAPWSYAATAAGILTTTAVPIKTAAGAGMRNYITGLEISNAGITAATVTVREVGGAVLWRGNAPAGIAQPPISFSTPLAPAANTSLEVVLSAAVALGVFVNVQGFVAA